MKFSIIVPIYNTEKYLSECIESILAQTYKDIEIILVNDGSKGNADEICKNYEKKDTRIKYFSKENEGVAIARNYGISKASGDYIFCVDSDDTISETFIEELSNAFESSNCDILIVGENYKNFDTKAIGCVPTCAFAVKKEFLDKYPDIRFQEHIQPCEDGLFTHKLMALTDNISKCYSSGYKYRMHDLSSEHSIKPEKILKDIPIWFKILDDFYNKYDVKEKNKLHLLAFVQL